MVVAAAAVVETMMAMQGELMDSSTKMLEYVECSPLPLQCLHQFDMNVVVGAPTHLGPCLLNAPHRLIDWLVAAREARVGVSVEAVGRI